MIIDQISKYALTKPNKLALVDSYSSLTYSDLFKRILIVRSAYSGLNNNGIVLIHLKPMASKWISIIALRSLGYTTVTLSDLNLLDQLKLKGVVGIIHEGLTDEQKIILNKKVPHLSFFQYHHNQLEEDKGPSDLEFDATWGDHIEYTSGSTGVYKAVLREGKDTSLLIERAINEFDICADNVFYLGAIHPATGVGNKVPLACFFMGATCIFNQAKIYMHGLVDSKADRAFMTPILMRECLSALDKNKILINKLRIYCGGGFLDSELAMNIKSKLNCTVVINYAATECGVVLQNEIDNPEDCVWLTPLSTKQIKIIDNQSNEIETNKVGSMTVQIENCDPTEYINDEVSSNLAFHGAYFHTGDLAIKRSDGKIRIVGREKNVINLGGDKYPVEPLEAAIKSDLNVPNVCIFSLQNASGKSYLSVVLEADHAPENELLIALTKKYAKFFSRINVHLLHKFPIQSSGLMKVDRKQILGSINKENLIKTYKITFDS